MRLIRAKDYGDVSRKAANIIAAQIQLKPDCVLGLATGSSPVGPYKELIAKYNAGELDFSQVWGVALFSALFIPFVMPKMHDRYYFMADMFALLYAARHPRRWWIPVCVIAASFICYAPFLMRQWTIPLQVAALLNLAAIIGVAKDVFTDMRAHALCEEAKD